MIQKLLEIEMKELKKIIIDVEKRIKIVTSSKLRVKNAETGFQYYLLDEKNNNEYGVYIKKSEIHLAKEIAQSDYDSKLLKNAKKQLRAIEVFLKKYEMYSVKGIFQKMHPGRRALVNGMIISDEEYIKRWEAVTFEGKQQWDNDSVIMTERGERVRSKSEKIIADKLYMLEIPYRYEYPIIMDGNIRVYPDFTILKMPERREVYLEHFGMMDDIDYVNTAIFKLNSYERNGICLGVDLFITYETSKKAINVKALDQMLKKIFC
ncbi:MAG: hypothetical protein IKW30_10810 [Lachnospiraceae bacterium]|nr:hypothetical protein [Lachnospiraceae bacterium]